MPAVLVTVPTATQNSPFLPSGSRNHRQYSLHRPTHIARLSEAELLENTGMLDPPEVVTNPSTNRFDV